MCNDIKVVQVDIVFTHGASVGAQEAAVGSELTGQR